MVGWVSIGVDDEGLFCARSVFLVLIILAFMSDLPCVTRRGGDFYVRCIYIFGAPKAGCREGNGGREGTEGERYVCVRTGRNVRVCVYGWCVCVRAVVCVRETDIDRKRQPQTEHVKKRK